MKRICLAMITLVFASLGSKSIYFGTGYPVATFEAAFQLAEPGDYLIEARTDTVNFEKGWKWLSFPALDVVLDNADLAGNVINDIIQLPFPFDLNYINVLNYTIEFYETWQNLNEQFPRTKGFKFCMNKAAQLNVTGFKIEDDASVFVAGNDGDNWVGYWLDETQNISDAFQNYWDGSTVHFIQHQYWTAIYYEGKWWHATANGQEPSISYGDMVSIRSYKDINDFHWNSSTLPGEKTIFPQPEYYGFEEQYNYVPIFIILDKKDLHQEIGAFIDDKCIGAAVVSDTLCQIRAYINGNLPGEIELEMHKGGENRRFPTYDCCNTNDPNHIKNKIDTHEHPAAWFISLKEEASAFSLPVSASMDLVSSLFDQVTTTYSPAVTISYILPFDTEVLLEICDLKKQVVKQLIDGEQPAGNYEVVWNGKDDAGKQVASGIYYSRIRTCGKTLHKKMLLLK